MIRPPNSRMGGSNCYMSNSNNSQRNMEMSRGNKGNYGNANNRTPKASKYRNDVSPFRGRFGSNVKVPDRLRKTPERNNNSSKSPMRGRLQINTRNDGYGSGILGGMNTPKEIGIINGAYGARSNFSPLNRR